MMKEAAAARSQSYRPDIDGLRAVAVLSVIGFHASSTLVPGGYVGVDIFFVISGFLITSIIFRSLEKGDFTFTDFYARRAKRIFPALIVVLMVICLGGWVVLLRDEFQQLGKHIAAGAGFISNFALWQESGYFDRTAATKPLLHLWSLGIEEQFYLLWPPFLVWAWKRKANMLQIVSTAAVISFVFNVVSVSLRESREMYYLPPVRFWELLLGCILAYAHQFRRKEVDAILAHVARHLPKSLTVHDFLAAAGGGLLLIGLVCLNSETLYPGWWGLLPTVGAALLILAGQEAWINRRLLSSRPLVFIGIISYPLYLWHWPFFAYLNIAQPNAASATMRLAAVVLSFLLAWLTYRLVEMPVRAQSNYAALVVTPALILVACLGVAAFSSRIQARSEGYGLEKIINAAGEWDFPGEQLKMVRTGLGYHMEQPGVSPGVLFLGDSNMQQYYPRIDTLFREHPYTTRRSVFVTRHGCPPLPYIKGINRAECAGVTEHALSLAQNPGIDTVVIAAAWWTHPVFSDPQNSERAFQALESVIKDYRNIGKHVYLILSIPKGADFDPYHLIARDISDFGFKIARTQVEQSKVVAELQPLTSRLVEIAKATGASTVDPVDFICREGVCPTLMADGSPIYKDGSHLRPAFVRQYATFMDAIVSIAGNP